jgi:hypothetical protein
MFNSEDIGETIEFLIANSKPGGRHMKKLLKIKEQVGRGVFLGPKARAFMHGMIEKLDNIECIGVTAGGRCTLIRGRGRCNHMEKFSSCERYQPVKATIKGSPLQGLGG